MRERDELGEERRVNGRVTEGGEMKVGEGEEEEERGAR